MANSRTKARIEARIRERVAYCVGFELNDPRATFITITKAEITSDLASAKVFYTVLGTSGDKTRTAHMLEDATGFIRKQLGRVLRTRRIPRLSWIYDDSIEFQENIEEAIARALHRDREINPEAHAEVPAPPPPKDADEVEADEDEDAIVDHEYLEYREEQEKEEGLPPV